MKRRSAMPITRPIADAPGQERAPLRGRVHHLFGGLAIRVSLVVGSPWAFLLAALVIVAWAATGPVFHYSDSWQLVINTGTTIVTFLMVFLIQHTQNKDARAIQLKLNELIAAVEGASARLINVETMSDEELDRLHARFQALADEMRARGDLAGSHSVEEDSARGPAETTGRGAPGGSAGGRP
jgi:low affinity Fe/Cu permease